MVEPAAPQKNTSRQLPPSLQQVRIHHLLRTRLHRYLQTGQSQTGRYRMRLQTILTSAVEVGSEVEIDFMRSE